MSFQIRLPAAALGAVLAVFAIANAWADNGDPPSRAARLSYTSGVTSFSPAGETEWVDTVVNRPLVSGDRLWTDKDGRAELEVGSSALRLDANTSFELVNLDDRTTQVQVTQGTLNVRLRELAQGQNYEVDTPTMALTLTQAGQYRIEVDADGQHTTVAVAHGSAEARGDNAEYPLQAGDRVRFHDSNLGDAEQLNANASAPDDFDRFSAARDARAEHGASEQYVGNDVVGTSDLDEYGSWSPHSDYGHVWYPSHVESNWAPYSDGHWMWQDPWGWTWVDNAPWGFAPSHYGRWVSIDNRWGWVPGPRGEQAVYAPALVAFIGGGGLSVGLSVGGAGPIGWFPLGAREIYEPSYHTSRDYFTRVNVTNTTINNTTITNVYNNYVNGRPLAQANYANRAIPGAVTAVPGNVFANAQPVRAAAIKMDSKQLASVQVTRMAAVAPSARSVIGNAPAAKAAPPNAVLERKVVARTVPPAKPLPFAARQQELQRAPGRPLAPNAIAKLQSASATATPRNVRVLGPQPAAVNARAANSAHRAPVVETKVVPHDNTALEVSKSHAPDQIERAPAPPQHHASASTEPKHKMASPPPQPNAPSHMQDRSVSTSSQPPRHAAPPHVQERSASTSSQQPQHAAPSHVQERSVSTSSQQPQHAAPSHVQERSVSTSSQQRQRAAQSHVQEHSAPASSQQQQHAVSSQQQEHASPAHVQERSVSAAPQQHNSQPSPPLHNAPAVQQKAKSTNKKDDGKDAKKDDNSNRGSN